MDVVNLGQSRHFLRERPIRVPLIDRPRLVGELICLEPGQQILRGSHPASDELYLVLEGEAHLRAGAQAEDLKALDSVVVPPGVEHHIVNSGKEPLMVFAVVTPKPTRAAETRPQRGPMRDRRERAGPRVDYEPDPNEAP